MRISQAAVGLAMLIASPATAQTTEKARISLNAGAGAVSSTSSATPGQAALITIGADVGLSPNWSLRLEAGRRAPSTRHWVNRETMYYFEAPDGGSPIGVASTVVGSDETIADIALLARRAWPHGERFEVGILAGPAFQIVRSRVRMTIPTSLTNPDDVEEFAFDNLCRLGVLDFGIDGGVRLSDRWHVVVYGMAGLPLQEHHKTQVRVGAMVKRAFR